MFIPVSQDCGLGFTWGGKNRIDVSIFFVIRDHLSSWEILMMSRIVHLKLVFELVARINLPYLEDVLDILSILHSNKMNV